MENKSTIGKNIKALRLSKGITQEQFAEKLFVAKSTISKWESDAAEPNTSILRKIAELLDVDMNELFETNHSTEEVKLNASKRIEVPQTNNFPIVYRANCKYNKSGSANIMSKKGFNWYAFCFYVASIVLVFVGVALFIKDNWTGIALFLVGILSFVITAVVHRHVRNNASAFEHVLSNSNLYASRKFIHITSNDGVQVQYLWKQVITITQQKFLRNSSRTGWSWFTGFNTVNGVSEDVSPIMIKFDDGTSVILNDYSQVSLDTLKTLHSSAS